MKSVFDHSQVNKFLIVATSFFISCLFFSSVATASVPAYTSVSGRILNPDGTPFTYNNTEFAVHIKSEDGTCLIYSEQKTGFDLSVSGGGFDYEVGAGTRVFPNPGTVPTFDFTSVFDNDVTQTCSGSGTWTPSSGSSRLLVLQFFDGTTWHTVTPSKRIKSTAFALFSKKSKNSENSDKLGGQPLSDFVLKTGIPVCTSGQFLSWSGSALSCAMPAVGGGGTVTDVISTNSYLTVSSSSSTPTLTINTGTAAGTLAAGNDTRIVNAVQPSSPVSGDVTGTVSSMTVTRVQGQVVASAVPSDGVLTWNSTLSRWEAVSPSSCATNQTQSWNAALDSFSCLNISALDSAVISTGTIDGARLPASATYWQAATGGIAYSSGKVGIGTATPLSALSLSTSAGTYGQLAVKDPVNYSTHTNLKTFIRGYDNVDNPIWQLGVEDNTNTTVKMGSWNSLHKVAITTNNQPRIVATVAGNVGVGIENPESKLQVEGTIQGRENQIASGSVVDMGAGNTHILENVGGSVITLNGLKSGASYSVIITDLTSRTYTFSGCLGSYFSPANAPTVGGTRTVYTLLTAKNGGGVDCYIAWISGFQ